ncbi:kinesin motor protein cin8 [Allomyces javanicus]|nr:kinesin motor protein cin8 [Allomyces javanicus]
MPPTPASAAAAETNIQVVLRCRPINDKEATERAHAVLAFKGVRGRELAVRAAIPSDRSLTKTFTFDRVYAPEASQELVFRDVVYPIVEEVVSGYNCTIFAYGQTGTGKTHTMQGDLALSPGGQLSPHAGMIPRALYALFEIVNFDAGDATVKVSCIELYNEELRDLLAVTDDDAAKLKLYEENRTVRLQGAQERFVKSPIEVIQLLNQATEKRQVAATKMNEKSSRSHCVFTVTVMIKESTPDGVEVMKVGKLNLVDLAGSENIGRSGAENRQAREAGAINQSLLTLGRVINALVEKQGHVPYRESKLTRLLKDSLGGHTKTCIIATVSPARSNLEETLSTLDYAHRAKNIRNKPKVNEHRSKRVIISEYEREIDQLRADLQATREKNGIFLAEARYQEMVATMAEQKEVLDQVQIDRADLEEAVRAETARADAAEAQAAHATAAYAAVRERLVEQMEAAKAMHARTEEDRRVVGYLAQGDARLRGAVDELTASLTAADRDVALLHEVLGSARGVVDGNREFVDKFRDSAAADVDRMRSELTAYEAAQAAAGDQARAQVAEIKAKLHESTTQTTTTITSLAATVASLTADLAATSTAASTADQAAHAALLQQHRDATQSLTDSVAAHARAIDTWVADTAAAVTTAFDTQATHHAQLDTRVRALLTAVAAQVDAHRASLAAARDATRAFVAETAAAARDAADRTRAAAAAEAEATERAADALAADVARLVRAFATDRAVKWAGVAATGAAGIDAAREAVDAFGAQSDAQDNQAAEAADAARAAVDECEKPVWDVHAEMDQHCDAVRASVGSRFAALGASARAWAGETGEKVESAHVEVERIAQADADRREAHGAEVRTGVEKVAQSVRDAARQAAQEVERGRKMVAAQVDAVDVEAPSAAARTLAQLLSTSLTTLHTSTTTLAAAQRPPPALPKRTTYRAPPRPSPLVARSAILVASPAPPPSTLAGSPLALPRDTTIPPAHALDMPINGATAAMAAAASAADDESVTNENDAPEDAPFVFADGSVAGPLAATAAGPRGNGRKRKTGAVSGLPPPTTPTRFKRARNA